MVQRYRPDSDEQERSFEMIQDDGGDYVAYEDYEELEAENRRLRALLHKCLMYAVFFSSDLVDEIKQALKEASHES